MMLGTVLAAMILGVAAGGADGREDEGMLPLLKRHEIQILLSVGLPLSAVAAKVGVSVDTEGPGPGARVSWPDATVSTLIRSPGTHVGYSGDSLRGRKRPCPRPIAQGGRPPSEPRGREP